MSARRDNPPRAAVSVSASGSLRSFVAPADVSVAFVARDGRIVGVNRAWNEFARANGADLQAVGPGANYFAVCRAGGPPGIEIAQRLERLAAGEERAFVHEYPCHSPSEERWMSMQAARVSGDGFEGITVSHVDITESVRERRRHGREHALLARVLDEVPKGIFWKDADLRYEGSNRLFNELAGLAPEQDIAGLTDRDLPLPSALIDALTDPQRQVLETGTGIHNAEFAITRSDRRRLVAASVSPLYDDESTIVGLVGVLGDITDAVVRSREDHVLRRYQTLARVAAAVAHEMNTPAQYVRGNLDFLKEAFADLAGWLETGSTAGDENGTRGDPPWLEEIPATLEDASEGVDQMSRSVQALLQFAASPGDENRETDLNLGLRGLVPVVTTKWPHLSDVMVDLDERVPVLGHRGGQVLRAVYALLDNAAEATRPMDDARIMLTTRRTDEGIEILVSDTGPGIPAALRERIFQPFFSTHEFGGQRGFGLPMARREIVDHHGGSLTVQSAEQGGTTFRVTLPFDQRDHAVPGVPAADPPESARYESDE